MPQFKTASTFEPAGDQPRAIQELAHGIEKGVKHQILLGVTGSGKTYSIAKVIEAVQRPTLVLTHNKTLAAQLYSEFRALFPDNAVEYFVSYYDYYQPEAYIPSTDTYIAKDSRINEEIERLRLSATSSLLSRRDTLVVASVSCIFSLGSPAEYNALTVRIKKGQELERDELLRQLVEIQYKRNDIEFGNGAFRVRGDLVEVHPAYEREQHALRIEFFGDQIERISRTEILRGRVIEEMDELTIFPARHFVTSQPRMEEAVVSIQKELEECLQVLYAENKLLEAQRLEQRTKYDLEMLREIGMCAGIENYSRHFDGRKPGDRPNTLMDFFPPDYLMVIDESHVTLPQVFGMYAGDRSRKEKLVEFGFRLPSALDNRPLKYPEFDALLNQVVYMSATPAELEMKKAEGVVVEQVIRPTGLIDPEVEVKPVSNQVDDLLAEIRIRAEKKERVLVTTLTKRMAEDLAEYLANAGVRVRYLHSEVETLERSDLIRDLRKGEFDVLVGINLLREGLDIPETSLVAILDADKEGFLRSTTSLIQTAGRAARNVNAKVILYADKMTQSMTRALEEMNRRREKQIHYNQEHGITPRSTYRPIEERIGDRVAIEPELRVEEGFATYDAKSGNNIDAIRNEMLLAAANLEFEKAAKLRDKIKRLEAKQDSAKK